MKKVTTDELLSKGFTIEGNEWFYNGDRPCLIDFYADWCMPCKSQENVLRELSEIYGEIDFYKVNIEEEYELAGIFSVRSLPTLLICGKETKQFTGLTQKKQIEDILKEQIEVVA